MRLLGFCTGCHRFRYVRCSGNALAIAYARGSKIVEGTCTECEEREEQARRARHHDRRREP